MKLNYVKIANTIMGIYYAFMIYEIIRRVFTIERKMHLIDTQQEVAQARVASVGASRFTIERKIIDDEIDKKQNNMRYNVYKKICLSILLTILPFIIKYIYYKRTLTEINTMYLSIISLSIHLLVNQIIDIDFTNEELEFIDN